MVQQTKNDSQQRQNQLVRGNTDNMLDTIPVVPQEPAPQVPHDENVAKADVERQLEKLFRDNEAAIEEIFKVLIRIGGPNLVDIYLKNKTLNSTATRILHAAHTPARKVGLYLFYQKVPGLLTEWLFEQLKLEFLKSQERASSRNVEAVKSLPRERLTLVENPTVVAYNEEKRLHANALAQAESRIAGLRRRIIQLSVALGISVSSLGVFGAWQIHSGIKNLQTPPPETAETRIENVNQE